ncbi:RNA-directed DNA polymerase, eukaryota [Tanacetum coccineum]
MGHWKAMKLPKFFHGDIYKKRSQLAIRGVIIDGDWIDEPCKVKNEFLMHFANRFESPSGPCIDIDSHLFKKLSSEQVDDLECDVTFDEIKKAVWDCGTNKSPGPDGFSFDFIRTFWDILKQDFVNAIPYFLVQSSLKSKAMIFKVDFEKAFDSVRWDFLDIILRNFGFGIKWRGWIQGCLSSAMGSILVNGSPTAEFKFHKGLKQGDPLSPYLLSLVMESLHLSFNNIINADLFKGIRFDDSLTLSHLFYADDAVFIGKWDRANILTIVRMLKCFFLASGLQINILKSKLMGIGVSNEEEKGLGIDFGKVSNRLSKWKIKTLSVGGRLTLIKSVLTSLPLYHMSLYKAPLGVLRSVSSLSPWNCILKELNSLSAKGIDLLALLKKKVGNESPVEGWQEEASTFYVELVGFISLSPSNVDGHWASWFLLVLVENLFGEAFPRDLNLSLRGIVILLLYVPKLWLAGESC